ESERAISDANRSLRELSAQAREVDTRLGELRAESERGQQALKQQQALLARMLYHHYVGGQLEPLKLLLNREDPNRIARQIHYFSYVSRARAGVISELRGTLERLKELAQDAEQKAAELAAITAEQQVQRQRLEREKFARSSTLNKISREIQQQRRQIGTLKRDEQRLARLVENLARIVARENRPAARLRNDRVPERSHDTGPHSVDGDAFGELKGRLSLPVRGELTNRFGASRADGGASWKGLFIAARAGDEVRAVAGGRVVFADWLRGFGNLLIVDHGGAYMSLYGNNESLYKQVGDIIHSGEAIASVGNSGGNADSGLYFELRHQGKPFDPLGWVNIK
ncbi:MAG TPA: peptidoglycan DD-metalloendopeptidase family protein, partial [Burkholderiales bacterium]|nr:peptidoglycan DD-metalloendopeptidase family protein [Burkholderiales bacterium]